MGMAEENLAKLQELTKDVNLTLSELKTIKWLSKWEPQVVDDIISIVNKLMANRLSENYAK
ncbi:MAG: hypothetical protein ACOX89_04205 [Lutispora sp.]|jgi:hypothetical protein